MLKKHESPNNNIIVFNLYGAISVIIYNVVRLITNNTYTVPWNDNVAISFYFFQYVKCKRYIIIGTLSLHE